ncbi:hypothetical protein [Actinoplanes sp. CA-252034]|uniref:hypothetical protein n=1 Tax=Actinoplanes sp. CA-252034 TaxID=3239906 RepID=UPI003D98BF1B
MSLAVRQDIQLLGLRLPVPQWFAEEAPELREDFEYEYDDFDEDDVEDNSPRL